MSNAARREDLHHEAICFGADGYHGSPLRGSFTETHLAAITQAICDFRAAEGIDGPFYLGSDAHALEEPQRTALEVLAANDVQVMLQRRAGSTPPAVISWAILRRNRDRGDHLADGLSISPSPLEEARCSYHPPNGGPAGAGVTRWLERRANDLLRAGNAFVRRLPYELALRRWSTREQDLMTPYLFDLGDVVHVHAIRDAGVSVCTGPSGAVPQAYWDALESVYGLMLSAPSSGPVDPAGASRTHAVAIRYLLANRPCWASSAFIGKSVSGSGLVDRVVERLDRWLYETPAGSCWFVPALFAGSCCFASDEGAGASFLRRDGTAWSTEKDGLVWRLLAAEIAARTGKTMEDQLRDLGAELGVPRAGHVDMPASAAQLQRLRAAQGKAVRQVMLAGEPITARLSKAPGNGQPLGGLKVAAENAWFVARPEAARIAIDAESFAGASHLRQLLQEAQEIVAGIMGSPD